MGQLLQEELMGLMGKVGRERIIAQQQEQLFLLAMMQDMHSQQVI
jgi:hypothetical protein